MLTLIPPVSVGTDQRGLVPVMLTHCSSFCPLTQRGLPVTEITPMGYSGSSHALMCHPVEI